MLYLIIVGIVMFAILVWWWKNERREHGDFFDYVEEQKEAEKRFNISRPNISSTPRPLFPPKSKQASRRTPKFKAMEIDDDYCQPEFHDECLSCNTESSSFDSGGNDFSGDSCGNDD